jgi:predicted nucleotide-binding protein
MQPPRVFVVVSFDSDGQLVQDAVQRAVEDNGFEVLQNDHSIQPGAALTARVLESIRKADLIVADINQQNPNVFFELGLARAMGKPTIILVSSKSGDRLPSDLTGLHFILYDPKDLGGLATAVRSETKALPLRWSA